MREVEFFGWEKLDAVDMLKKEFNRNNRTAATEANKQ